MPTFSKVTLHMGNWLPAGSKEAGRMGALTNLLLRTLFDTLVTVNNVVVKYVAHTTVATFTCQSVTAATCQNGWRANYEVIPELPLYLISHVRLMLAITFGQGLTSLDSTNCLQA